MNSPVDGATDYREISKMLSTLDSVSVHWLCKRIAEENFVISARIQFVNLNIFLLLQNFQLGLQLNIRPHRYMKMTQNCQYHFDYVDMNKVWTPIYRKYYNNNRCAINSLCWFINNDGEVLVTSWISEEKANYKYRHRKLVESACFLDKTIFKFFSVLRDW